MFGRGRSLVGAPFFSRLPLPFPLFTATVSKPCFLSSRAAKETMVVPPMPVEDMQFFHHGKRPRFRGKPKFKSPLKRANILMTELQKEVIEKSIAAKPKVWETPFRIGDAVEIEQVEEGGVNAVKKERIRGVVLGRFRKGIDHTILIRDVMFGTPMETRVPLHSPLVKAIKILEPNFINKGKKRVRKAKLYYVDDRNPLRTYHDDVFVFLAFYFVS
jgi:large subunit ribosomal protein L19